MRQTIIFFALLFSISAKCQKLTMVLGPQVAFPNGNFQLSAGNGWGIFSRYDYKLSERLIAIGSIDGISFAEKSVSLMITPGVIYISKSSLKSAQLGARFNVLNRSSSNLYVSAELGLSQLHFRLSNNQNQNVDTSDDYNFCYRYAIGYSMKRWDISYSQQFVSNGSSSINFFAIRLGYRIVFNKAK